VFVTFEGPDGAGKTTALQACARALAAEGRSVWTTREPGEGEFGGAIRTLLLEGGELDPWTETFLFLADRREHIRRGIRPRLERGEIVLCDRFSDSTIVYQGHARGLSLTRLRELCRIAEDGLSPRLTLLIDLEPEIGLQRIESKDRLDREPLAFHQKVRNGFIAESLLDPERWHSVDGGGPPEAAAAACLAAIRARL
jgi:dTMP kinase